MLQIVHGIEAAILVAIEPSEDLRYSKRMEVQLNKLEIWTLSHPAISKISSVIPVSVPYTYCHFPLARNIKEFVPGCHELGLTKLLWVSLQ